MGYNWLLNIQQNLFALKVSTVQIMHQHLVNIEYNKGFNAFNEVFANEALKQAAKRIACCLAAPGSDTGDSIRHPVTFCGRTELNLPNLMGIVTRINCFCLLIRLSRNNFC